MKRPDEWARAARALREAFPEEDFPTIHDKLTRLEHRFTLASEQTSAGAVELGELVNVLAETGQIHPQRAVEILDRLYEQRSYAAR